MESQRRRKVVNLDAVAGQGNAFSEFLKKWGNTALTILLIGALIWLGIQWRAKRAAENRMAVMADLTTARTYVQVLENENPGAPADYLAHSRSVAAAQAADAISLVLNTGDDPKLKAEALVVQGDLNWQLANFPPLPGAATQPALVPPMTSEQYLNRAADSYQQVLSNSDYASEHEALTAARFGLAAVAENRHQWDEARKQLQAVIDDPDAIASLRDQARVQLANLANIQTPLYLAPSTQPANGAIAMAASTTQSTAATTRPTAAPMAPSAWKMGIPAPLAKSPQLVKPSTQPAGAGPATQPVSTQLR